MMIASEILSAQGTDAPRFINRGISGNRIVDLDARIKSDIINLKPDLLSILIGVNDTWHEKTDRNGVDVAKYERVYRSVLQEVKEALPSVILVLCEPFVLQCGVVTEEWVDEINQRRAVVAKLANEFGAVLVPFQSMFDEAVKQAPPAHWAPDGVHPTIAGHQLMAQCWMQKTESL
jgi:lysophospholipase L1-like esterase